jgi:hypothetical protein
MTTSDLVAAIRPVVEAVAALGVRHYFGARVLQVEDLLDRALADADRGPA